MIHNSHASHIGSAYSVTDILSVLYADVAKYDINNPKNDDRDYVFDTINKQVIEYKYDGENWNENKIFTNLGVGPLSGIEIKNDEYGYEKILCKNVTGPKEYFIINQNTGLGEIVYVPIADTVQGYKDIIIKVFGFFGTQGKEKITNIVGNGPNDLKFIPNNICTSNITYINGFAYGAKNFNQPLNRWDVSAVNSEPNIMFKDSNFNQDLSSWCFKISSSGYIDSGATQWTLPKPRFNSNCSKNE